MKCNRCIPVILAIIIISMIPLTAAAESFTDNQVQPCYTYIDAVTAGLSINSSTGLATCSGTGYAKGTTDVVSLTVLLQQNKDGTWHTLKSWSGSNTNMAVVEGQYYVYKGYTYRTKVTEIVYDKNGNYLESASCTYERTY